MADRYERDRERDAEYRSRPEWSRNAGRESDWGRDPEWRGERWEDPQWRREREPRRLLLGPGRWHGDRGEEPHYGRDPYYGWREGEYRGERESERRPESDWGREETGRRPWGGYSGRGSAGGGMTGHAERGQYTGRGPKGYQRSDERIREDIADRLTENPDIDASDLEIQVSKGEVTLSGTVADRYMKRIAEEITEDVSGVREVHNNIRAQRQGILAG